MVTSKKMYRSVYHHLFFVEIALLERFDLLVKRV